jgi:DNA-binding response OmpR family regulator
MGTTGTILLISDDLIKSKEYSGYLKRSLFSVISSNISDAVSTASKISFDIVLIRLDSSSSDEVSTIKAIKERPQNEKVAVFCVLPNSEDFEKARSMGADDFLLEPFGLFNHLHKMVSEKINFIRKEREKRKKPFSFSYLY